MLKHWTSHEEYLSFISNAARSLNDSQRKKLSSFDRSISKLSALNLDPLCDFLAPLYSNTGRPALNQPEIFRSLILMLDLKETKLSKWVESLRSDDILCMLIGCCPDSLPPLGSYYDFIDRLWLRDPSLDREDRKGLYAYPKSSKPKGKSPGKNKKLPNPHSQIVKKLADAASSGRSFPLRYEKLLQELFSLIAVRPSIDLGLIQKTDLTIAGDGTCVHTHSSSLGHKVCDCKENGIFDCKCDRKYSDLDATYGWDSDLATWFYGHTLYALSSYDPITKTDLPLYFRFVSAKRHDSVTGIVALAEFRELLPQVSPKNICFDSANDNYPTYELCKQWNIIPFIDLNSKRGIPESLPSPLSFSEKGVPICMGGHEMKFYGFCKNRSRHKWRCPLTCGLIDTCARKEQCSPSPYGRVIYTKPDWDVRLFTPVPRGTKEWKSIYKARTCSERVNNRILNDYGLHAMRIHGKKRYSFFTMMIGINIHLDARIKKAALL